MMSAQLQQPGAAPPSASPFAANTAAGQASGVAQHPAAEQQSESDSGNQAPVPLVNRANKSNSPYIRAHAGSPVKWQLLDDETIERAKRENKLVFLNVGFRACHYCSLTTEESFSHPSVASLLNEAFIPVIVDREERPDIDTIYMNYIQAVNGVGGWPINVFLTPELEPVFGGTYWPGPGTERGGEDNTDEGSLDFLVILQKMEKVWQEQETRCRKEAQEILDQLRVFAAEGTLGARGIGPPGIGAPGIATPGTGTPGISTPTTPTGTSSAAATAAGVSATMTNLGASRAPASAGAPPLDLDLDLDLDQLEEAFTHIAGAFDAVNGGFGAEPKFPTPARLSFLLRLARFPAAVADVVGGEEVRHATLIALHTLRHMRDGGLRDHVGAGFARYSITADWALPHFEKMVPDNALLLGVYLDAWLGQAAASGGLKREDEFADVVLELADYLTSPPILGKEGGGFASSEAADSFYRRGDRHMREGAYYVWTRREFDAVVGGGGGGGGGAAGKDAGQHASSVAAAHWNVLEHGNVPRHHDPHDEFLNQNVLSVAKSAAELSGQFFISVDEVKGIVASAKERLLAHRERERVRPDTDGKVVASYNGMVIAALARIAAAVREVDADRSARYLTAAAGAAEFVREKLWDAEKKVLFRSFYEFRSKTRGFADDYAFMIEGLLELFEATGEEKWVEWADELQRIQIDLFYDAPTPTTTSSSGGEEPSKAPAQRASSGAGGAGGFYSTEASAAHTILRLKDGMDTAQPSTNGVSASNLFRLGALLGDARYAGLARETINAFEVEMLQYPWLFVSLLSGVVAARLGARSRVVVVGEDQGEEEEEVRRSHKAPRAEARVLVRLGSGAAAGSSWLLRRNGALDKFVAGGGRSGVFEWKDGVYGPVDAGLSEGSV